MRVLVELPTWLGDAVMATPAIEILVKSFNDLEITIIGSVASIEVLKNHPNVTETHVLNKKYISIFILARNLGRFDKFFSFRSSSRSKVLKALIRSKKKFQFTHSNYLQMHQVEKYNAFVNQSINTNFESKNLKVYSDKLSPQISIDSKKTLGINPGASYGSAKRWYPEEFAEVASKLAQEYDVLILGALSELEIADEIERFLKDKGIKNYKNLAGKTSLQELIKLISSLNLFITGDSGPMHLAASFKVPTVAIFGPTNDKETSQYKFNKGLVVKAKLDCQPCMKRSCPLNHHNCMKFITADDVIDAVKKIS